MAKDDPMGDWIPMMSLFGGLGVTGYKAAQEMSSKSSFSAPWQRAKDAEQTAEMLKSGFSSRAELAGRLYTPASVSEMFFPSPSRIASSGIPLADAGKVVSTTSEYAYQATRGFIFTHGLEAQVKQEFGQPFSRDLNNSKVMQKIIGMHPRGAESFSQRASSYGIVDLLSPIDDRYGPVQSGLQRRAKSGAVQNLKMQSGSAAVAGITPKSAYANPASRLMEMAVPDSQSDIYGMLQSRGVAEGSREALSLEIHKLHQQVAGMEGVDVKLTLLRGQAEKEVLSGVRVTSRRNGAFLDVPFEQRGGTVYTGEFGQTRAVARRVAKSSSEIRGIINTPGAISSAADVLKLSNPLSLHTLQKLNSTGSGGLSSLGIQSGSGRISLSNYAISRYGDDTASSLIQYNANKGLNARVAGQMTMAHLQGESGFQALKQEVSTRIQPFVNPYGGLGPSHAAQPLLNVRGGRLPGSGELGQWVGDPKGQAQAMRGTSYYPSEWSGGRGRGNLLGKAQLAMGDKLPEMRVANIDKNLLEGLLLTDERYAHMSLSSDEILSTKNAASRRHVRQFTGSVSEIDDFGKGLMSMSDADVIKMRQIGGLMESGATQSEAIQSLSRQSLEREVSYLADLPLDDRNNRLYAMAESLVEPDAQRPLNINDPDLVRRATVEEFERVGAMSRLESGQRAGFNLSGQEVAARGGQTVYVKDFMIDEGQLKMYGTSATEGGVLTKTFGDLKTVTKFSDLDPITARSWAATQEMLGRDPRILAEIGAVAPSRRAELLQPLLREVQEAKTPRAISALRAVGDIDAISNAGVKDLSERGLAPMNRAMASELSALHTAAVEAGDEASQEWTKRRLSLIGAELDSSTGRFIVEDDILKGNVSERLNQVKRFESLAESFSPFSSYEPSSRPGTIRIDSNPVRWTAERYIADQSNSFKAANRTLEKQGTAVSKAEINRQATVIENLKSAAKTGSYSEFRAAAGDSFRSIVGNQLGHGTWNYSAAVEGRAAQRLGTGRQASASGQLFGHLKSQNSIMASAADEMLSRTQGAYSSAKDLSKGIAYGTLGAPVPEAISMADPRMPTGAVPKTAQGLRSPQTAGIFSLNPEVRSRSASQIREAFGLAQGADIVFDAGEGAASRNLYYIEEIHDKLTRGQRLPDGSSTLGRYDRTLADAIQAQGSSARAEAAAAHQSRVVELAQRKGGPLSEIDKGKVIGSRQLQAGSALEEGLMQRLGKRGQVGVFESTVREMATEMGVDSSDYIKNLRAGDEAIALHRWPMSEQMRVMPAQAFSMDQAIEEYAKSQSATMSPDQMLKNVERLEARDPLSGKMDLIRQRAAEAGLEGRSGMAQVVRSTDLAEALIRDMGREAANSAFFGLDDVTKMGILSSTGIDFDADQVGVTLFKDKELRQNASQLSKYNLSIVEALVDNSKLDASARLTMDQVLEQTRGSATLANPSQVGAYDMAERQATYQYQRQELFDELQRSQVPLQEAEVRAVDGVNTEAARRRMSAEAIMGRTEKATIGPLTNQVDFTRRVFREGFGSGGVARVAVMGELLLGALPEVALKARQGGTGQAEELSRQVNTILESMSGRPTPGQQAQIGSTIPERAAAFEGAFRELHGTVPKESLDRLFAGGISEDIIRASDKGSSMGESLLHRMTRLPSGAETGSAEELISRLSDPTNTNVSSSVYRDSAPKAPAQGTRANLARATEVGGDMWSAIGKHKKAALVGAGVAVAGSMLLGSPGHISEEEAMAAGARHQSGGNPAHPQIDTGNSARLRTGTSVRVRGQSMAEMDYQRLSASIDEAYPGSDKVFNVNDQGANVDAEYIRKLLSR
jgi:hypothetical protein